jgi:D-cysteine desulfhydrase
MHRNEPPRLPLAHLPTPVAELKNLAKRFGVPRFLMKRDDLTGLETTGNKIRKLEYVVADALRAGCDTLVTHGGYQSNHCRATAAVGARLGLRVRLILRSAEEEPDSDGNLFLDRLFGAEVTLHEPDEYNARRQELIDAAMQYERQAGRKPYFFPVGASIPLGCWGYIRAARELASYLGREKPIDIFVPVSSSGTIAGLVLGRALFRCRNWRIVGVVVSDSVEYFQEDVAALIQRTITEHQLEVNEYDTSFELLGGFIGEGYAIPYPEALNTVRLLARLEGILLDPTYTAKAMTGMLSEIRDGRLRKDALPLFVHTGGAFGLLARRDLLAAT